MPYKIVLSNGIPRLTITPYKEQFLPVSVKRHLMWPSVWRRVRTHELSNKECQGKKGDRKTFASPCNSNSRAQEKVSRDYVGRNIAIPLRDYYECHLSSFAEYSNCVL